MFDDLIAASVCTICHKVVQREVNLRRAQVHVTQEIGKLAYKLS